LKPAKTFKKQEYGIVGTGVPTVRLLSPRERLYKENNYQT
jgi:hypothetical protein